MKAASLVYDFLQSVGATEIIRQYGLEPFVVLTQSIERTFIDKVFAIADYYLDGHLENHSRHIYDLYKLYPHIAFDDSFSKLAAEVRAIRRPHAACLSANEGVDLPELLQKIISEGSYKTDYKHITGTLLLEDVPYEEAISVVRKVLDDGCFAQ